MNQMMLPNNDANKNIAGELFMIHPDQNNSNLFEQFEVQRLKVNKRLEHYFQCISHDSPRDDLPGLNNRFITFQGDGMSSGNPDVRLSKQFCASAVQELVVLNEVLEGMRKQQRPLLKAVSPILVSLTTSCVVFAYALPHPDLSRIFLIGGVANGVLSIIRLVRAYRQSREILPLRHKVRGLIRAFKNGTIRYRDLDGVLILSLD